MYSAVKVNGKPLYRLAREGKEIERAPRPVLVYRLELLSFGEQQIEIELHCSHGFYVRGLAHDLGESLGCGAHVVALRRLHVAGLGIERAITLEDSGMLGESWLAAAKNFWRVTRHCHISPLSSCQSMLHFIFVGDSRFGPRIYRLTVGFVSTRGKRVFLGSVRSQMTV